MQEQTYFKAGLSKDELTLEYRRLAKQYHPDVCKEPNANEIMQKINIEYDNYFVSIQKDFVGFDWDDLFRQYREARRTRETILGYMRRDRDTGRWFTFLPEDYWVSYHLYYEKSLSDDGESWKNFHGGFALVQENPRQPDGLRTVKRIPARIETPSLADLYFAQLGGATTTSNVLSNYVASAAHVNKYDSIRYARTSYGKEFWIDSVNDKKHLMSVYVKVNGLIMQTDVPASIMKDAHTKTYYARDIGFLGFQDCTLKEFEDTHDVDYKPRFSDALDCKSVADLYWVDDPVVAHFARMGVVKFYSSGSNFRMRYGSFSSDELYMHLMELTIDDAERIQDYLDTINQKFEDDLKLMIHKGRVKIDLA